MDGEQKLPWACAYLIFLGQKVVGIRLQLHEMSFKLIYLYGAVMKNKARGKGSYWRNGKSATTSPSCFQKQIN